MPSNKITTKEELQKPGNLQSIPLDILILIFLYLNPRELLNVGQASKLFCLIANSNILWKSFLMSNLIIGDGLVAKEVFKHRSCFIPKKYKHFNRPPLVHEANELLLKLRVHEYECALIHNNKSSLHSYYLKKLKPYFSWIASINSVAQQKPQEKKFNFFSKNKQKKEMIQKCDWQELDRIISVLRPLIEILKIISDHIKEVKKHSFAYLELDRFRKAGLLELYRVLRKIINKVGEEATVFSDPNCLQKILSYIKKCPRFPAITIFSNALIHQSLIMNPDLSEMIDLMINNTSLNKDIFVDLYFSKPRDVLVQHVVGACLSVKKDVKKQVLSFK